MPDAAKLNQRDQPDHRDCEGHRRPSRQYRSRVLPERRRRERHRGGESYRRGDPSCHKPERAVKAAAEEIVFTARARKHRAELTVGKHSAERDESADHPEQQYCKARRDVLDLKPEAGEDPHPHHVGHHNGGRHHQRNRGPALGQPGRPSRASGFYAHIGPWPPRGARLGGASMLWLSFNRPTPSTTYPARSRCLYTVESPLATYEIAESRRSPHNQDTFHVSGRPHEEFRSLNAASTAMR